MLLMVKEGIRGGICHAIHRYAKASNKYMRDYNKDEEESFLQYVDSNTNNLYGFAMIQPLSVDGLKWKKKTSKFNEDFIKNYDENSNKGYMLTVNVEYPKNLHDLHSDLPFLPEKIKINKYSKLVCNLHDKNNYVVYIRALKHEVSHGLILKRVHRVFKFNQEAWLKELSIHIY